MSTETSRLVDLPMFSIRLACASAAPHLFHTLRVESRLHVRDACCSTHMCVWEALGARRFVVADIMEVLGLASTIQAGRLR